VNTKFKKSIAHQWNWMKSTRFSRPMGHLGTGLTFGLPFGLLALVSAARLGLPGFGLAILGWTVIARLLQSVLIGRYVAKDREAVRLAVLYPLRDLIGSLLWMASYASRRVGWRDDLFEFTGRGVVRLIPRDQRRAGVYH
jgi:ceramide glucosyltransferase